jgi:hypothetical protein
MRVKAPTKKLDRLLRKTATKNPDPDDVAELRKALREEPGTWRAAGDMLDHAQDQVIQSMASGYAVIEESTRRGKEELREELSEPTDGPLEQLMIQEVILCWLHHSHTVRRMQSVTMEGTYTTKDGTYWEKRVAASQRRYIRAMKSLARVRKLNVSVQINVAQQFNYNGSEKQ